MKNNLGVVNVYQNYDQVNYFVIFQKEENGQSFKKMLDLENGLKKSKINENIFIFIDFSSGDKWYQCVFGRLWLFFEKKGKNIHK